MNSLLPISAGQILAGPLFNEPMRVETVQANGLASWVVGLVGMQSERFRKVTLTADDIRRLTILDALEDDAVFNVVGEILPAAHVERMLRDYYAGRLGDADLEERLLRNVDEGQFRAICQNALEGLASKKLNLEMLIERRAQAQEHRVVPETIARFLREAAEFVPLTLKTIPSLPHTFEPARTPPVLRRYEKAPDWKLPALVDRYPRCSTDRLAPRARARAFPRRDAQRPLGRGRAGQRARRAFAHGAAPARGRGDRARGG